jgi:hypothetical protein
MLIGELINNLAQKAGVSSDNEELKALLSSPELAAVKVPDALTSDIDKGLLSIEAAKNNHPDIKKKYFADAYDGMDKQLIALIESDTFDEADIAEIKAEKSTSKKAELIVSKLKAAKKGDKGANADEWNKKIADANEAARLAKDEVTKVTQGFQDQIKNIRLEASLDGLYGTYKTIYDELPAGIKKTTLKAVIDQALQDKNAQLVTDEQGNIQLIGKDGTNVFGSNNVQLTAKSFLDQSLAPILKVSGPAPAAAAAKPTVVTTTGGDANTGYLKSINDQALLDLSAPRASMM